MQPSSKYLHNEEIVSTSSNVDECTKVFIHEETEEQVDAHVVLPSQKGPLLDSTPIEKNDDFQIECNQSNQDILGSLEKQSADIIDEIPSSEDLIHYLKNIDEDFANWSPKDLLEEVQNFHSQVKCHNNQEELNKDEINQEINQDPQSPSVLTNDVSFNVLNEVKENIQPHDQLVDKRKNNCHLNLRIQRFPPPSPKKKSICF